MSNIKSTLTFVVAQISSEVKVHCYCAYCAFELMFILLICCVSYECLPSVTLNMCLCFYSKASWFIIFLLGWDMHF